MSLRKEVVAGYSRNTQFEASVKLTHYALFVVHFAVELPESSLVYGLQKDIALWKSLVPSTERHERKLPHALIIAHVDFL